MTVTIRASLSQWLSAGSSLLGTDVRRRLCQDLQHSKGCQGIICTTCSDPKHIPKDLRQVLLNECKCLECRQH